VPQLSQIFLILIDSGRAAVRRSGLFFCSRPLRGLWRMPWRCGLPLSVGFASQRLLSVDFGTPQPLMVPTSFLCFASVF